MLVSYGSIAIYILFCLLIAAAFFGISHCLGPKNPTPEKNTPFECGNPTNGNISLRSGVKFLVIAIIFVAFDVEIVFLYPWAQIFNKIGWTGFIELLIFIGILGLGIAYVWKTGSLEWEK